MGTHFRTLKIKDIRRETPDCVSVAFAIPDALKEEFLFTQGQNITIKLNIDGEELRRSYSICSSPLEDELRIAVKRQEKGRFSNFINNNLTSKQELEVLPPTGRFYTSLDPNNKKRYLAFAAGSGITPVISIIKTVLLTEPKSSFTLVYGNRDRNSIIFKEELEALKNRFIDRLSIFFILSRERTESTILEGRIDEIKCQELFEKMPELSQSDEIFLCGPEQMIFSLQRWMEKRGIEKRRIHFELFSVPGQNKSEFVPESKKEISAREGVCKVTVRSDGTSISFDLPYEGKSVLDAAIDRGADLPFSCKGGVCATCRARLLEGEVEMDSNFALEPDELTAGYILTCQSHPRSPRLTVDFDRTG